MTKRDIPEALCLVWRVFSEFEAPDFSDEGISEFKSFIAPEKINANIDSGEMDFWACRKEGKIVGVIATRNVNHISMLFVEKKFHRQGIGKNLLQIVINECRNEQRQKITVNSSPYAVNIYQKMGFDTLDSEQILNGIRFTPMVYLLD